MTIHYYYRLSLNRLETIKLLIERGSIIDEPGKFGDTPVYHALECGRLDIAEYFVSKGSQTDGVVGNDWSFITNAFINGFSEDAIKFLVGHESKVDWENERYILGDEFYNLTSDDDWKLEYLASVVDINEILDFESKSPLMHFLINGEHEMVEKMVKLGAKFEVREDYAWLVLRRIEKDAWEDKTTTLDFMMPYEELLLDYAYEYDNTPGFTQLIMSDVRHPFLDLLIQSKKSETCEMSYKQGKRVISGLNCSLIISRLTQK